MYAVYRNSVAQMEYRFCDYWQVINLLPSKRYDPDMLPDSLDLDDEKYASCIYGQVAVT